ncbi:MAG: EamA family transporter [Dehalococcoides mccartyi]|uniref:EamA family transporter n=1 Tax=Dehalococcoides TaxID=61434 RepID=UPI002737CF71|nr:EamA family transporter [Dehalococcoides mccartyi]MDP4280209.1 EamA family transporter [Dehalococcoides mccartyi]
MWIIFAFGSAVFAGMTAILAKLGIRNVDSNLATAIRTIVVLIFSCLMVFIVGSQDTLGDINSKTVVFLVLSGVATGASWLCYFKAIQLGDVNKVAPIDRSSVVLTMILAIIFFNEAITVSKVIGIIAIGIGTLLMTYHKQTDGKHTVSYQWLIFAILSAVFAAFTAILAKVGIQGVESNLGTAIRTVVVLIMAWVVVFAVKKPGAIKHIDNKSWLFICLSGIATGASWLCFYRALQIGPASIVVPIDKLSIVFTVAFSFFFLKEKLLMRPFIGLVLIVGGTLGLLVS